MTYNDPPLSYPDLAERAISRGLTGISKEDLAKVLAKVSYNKLSVYWHTFKVDATHFREGTHFDEIWRRYSFDCELRCLIFMAIGHIELAFRNDIVHYHAVTYKAFGYLDRATLPGIEEHEHVSLVDRLRKEVSRSNEHFVTSHLRMHPGEDLPIWTVAELMTMGSLLTFYRGMAKHLKSAIASRYRVSDDVFTSWFGTLNFLRNICAHHSRIWNRVFSIVPKIPQAKKHPEWHDPVQVKSDRTFGVLSVVMYLLWIIDNDLASDWRRKLLGLLLGYGVDLAAEAGFPDDWEDYPIWNGSY